MPDELLTRLNGLGASLERTLDEVRLHEVRARARRHVVEPVPRRNRGPSRRRLDRRLVAAAAAVALVVAGLVMVRNARSDTQPTGEPGQPALGSTLVDQLVGRTWVAVDYPLPTLPVMRFERGGRGNQVTVDANDTCNGSTGVMSFDGSSVFESEVMTTAMYCGNPMIAPFANGTTFRLVGDELTVDNTAFGIRSTRYVATESLEPLSPESLPGEYLYGAAALRITADEFTIDGCTFPWTSDGPAIAFDASICRTSIRVGWRWFEPIRSDALLTTADGDVVIEASGGFTRLDRVAPGGQPTLGAFLGTVSHRRWILDVPHDEYPSGVRPFVQFAPYEAPDVVPAAYGFDGCAYVEVGRDEPKAGAWTSTDDGWVFYTGDAGTSVQPAECAPELWLPFTGASYRLSGTRELEMVAADGTTWSFRDAESLPDNDPAGNTPALAVGRWQLEPDRPVIEFDQTTGTVTVEECTMSWESSDRTMALTAPQNCEGIADRSVARLVQMTRAERTITVGLSDDLATLYLYTDHPLFTALRFSRVP